MNSKEPDIDRRAAAYNAFKAAPDYLAARLAVLFTTASPNQDFNDPDRTARTEVVGDVVRLIGGRGKDFLRAVADKVLYYAELENTDARISEQNRNIAGTANRNPTGGQATTPPTDRRP